MVQNRDEVSNAALCIELTGRLTIPVLSNLPTQSSIETFVYGIRWRHEEKKSVQHIAKTLANVELLKISQIYQKHRYTSA